MSAREGAAHTRQLKRPQRVLRRRHTILGSLLREVAKARRDKLNVSHQGCDMGKYLPDFLVHTKHQGARMATADALRKGATAKPRLAKLLPPHAVNVVNRRRVHQAVEAALQGGICWVAAPAGYGKTTALADYASKRALPCTWYRIDQGDRDVASLFHYLRLLPKSPRGASLRTLPVFGPEYADQPEAFARRFFRHLFISLPDDTLVVLDDLHYADTPAFRNVLLALLQELPPTLRCACLSRTLHPIQLNDLVLSGRMKVVDQSLLEFTSDEAKALMEARGAHDVQPSDIAATRGWAVGLLILAQRGSSAAYTWERPAFGAEATSRGAVIAALGQRLFDVLPSEERELLLQLSLLPDITVELADALAGQRQAREVLARLRQRQLLTAGGSPAWPSFRMHDLLRDLLRDRLTRDLPQAQLDRLRERVAGLLDRSGHREAAIELALQASAWDLARRLIHAQAGTVLAQGRRATVADWCLRTPEGERDGWLYYWLGVAHVGDDSVAERWLSRAWLWFEQAADARGLCMTAAQAVLSKTDSWRTHEGLATWTRRAAALMDAGLPALAPNEYLLVLTGMLRALDFAEDYGGGEQARRILADRLLQQLRQPNPEASPTLRLLASETLIEHAGSSGDAGLFEQAVDCVAADVRDHGNSPWALGLWLVAFGAVSGRYFPYARRGFPYAGAEEALRAAIAIGEREALRGVEFGALYHLQLQMKLRNDWAEFAALVNRLNEIADTRYTTQVAVVADCQAAAHTAAGNVASARQACERFMAAIEAADEPPIERWPHFITHYQVLLADGKAHEAARLLEDKLALFEGGVRLRTEACISIAYALQAQGRAQDQIYVDRLQEAMGLLSRSGWSSVLSNLPGLLARLCADALRHGIAPEFCRGLIRSRRLAAPPERPAYWPWPLKVHVLGSFQLERDDTALELGAKAPVLSLELVRALAVAKDHTCTLDDLHDWFWPEADGDRAKAACEQALLRLRRLLGEPDLVVQRESKLRLAPDKVWVDLDWWEPRLKEALATSGPGFAPGPAAERTFFDFPGPLLPHARPAAWLAPAAERIRSKLLDLALRLGSQRERSGDARTAKTVYLRALDAYPDAPRLYEALIRLHLGEGDRAAALEGYTRFQRIGLASLDTQASAAIARLIEPLLRA